MQKVCTQYLQVVTDTADHDAQIQRWKVLSYVGAVVCVGLTAMNIAVHHAHEHNDAPQPKYMNIRNKKFCWKDGDTPLFQMGKNHGHGEHH